MEEYTATKAEPRTGIPPEVRPLYDALHEVIGGSTLPPVEILNCMAHVVAEVLMAAKCPLDLFVGAVEGTIVANSAQRAS